MCEKLLVKKLSEHAIIPTRGSISSAGLDLYAAHTVVIPAKGKSLVHTDLSIALPQNTYGRIAPRSSLALKNHIDVGAGVIDMDYRGHVGVVLFNFSDVDFVVNRGDRFAQLIVERIYIPDIVVVVGLGNTERGYGGFGSTGFL